MGLIADRRQPRQSCTALERMQTSKQVLEVYAIVALTLPTLQAIVDGLENFIGFLKEDLDDVRVEILERRDFVSGDFLFRSGGT